MIRNRAIAMAGLSIVLWLGPGCNGKVSGDQSNAPISPKLRSCALPAGMNNFLEGSQPPRWVIVGEIHGTVEIPREFGNLVCGFGATFPEVTVGVELPSSRQSQLDKLMRLQSDREFFAEAPKRLGWDRITLHDGRTSRAFLELLAYLRKLHQNGNIKNIIAFAPSSVNDQIKSPSEYEAKMADNLLAAATHPNSVVVALVGNSHAERRERLSPQEEHYLPAGAQLPEADTVLLRTSVWGGSAWNCQAEPGSHAKSNSSLSCGPHSLYKLKKYQYGIVKVKNSSIGVDGYFNLARDANASPPYVVIDK